MQCIWKPEDNLLEGSGPLLHGGGRGPGGTLLVSFEVKSLCPLSHLHMSTFFHFFLTQYPL